MEKTIGLEIVFECPAFQVEKGTVETITGMVENRWYVKMRGGAFVIPLDSEGNILLIQEWRSASQNYSWRIPAGKIDPGEEPIVTARRELREEIGFDAKSLEFFMDIVPTHSYVKDHLHYFVACDLFESPLDTGDEPEPFKIYPTTPDKILQMIAAEEIQGPMASVLKRFVATL